MTSENFSPRLLETVLLLVGLSVFNSLIVVVPPFFGFSENYRLFVQYSPWIGQTIFGFIIYSKLRGDKNATSIGVLSTCMPIFGGLFYLLAIAFRPAPND